MKPSQERGLMGCKWQGHKGGAASVELTSPQHVLQIPNVEPQDFPVVPVFGHIPSFHDLFPPFGNEDIYSMPLYPGLM
jgi:hypothetical protein